MIGALCPNSRIRDNIVFSTNNLSNLEEKNILEFLSTVEKEIKISNLFGNKKEKALGKYVHFVTVLKGLSRLSRNTKIIEAQASQNPGFSVSNRKQPNAVDVEGELGFQKVHKYICTSNLKSMLL